ncbi:MAG: methionine biosynthesis protein MetW [Bryobacteraceae bacterium]
MSADESNGAVSNSKPEADPDELAAILEEIQIRVRERHAVEAGGVPMPDLLPILHARDAAQGKVASIGRVNPRRGGLVNNFVQALKRLVSRALDWHVREQVEFNQAAVASVDAILHALEENNRVLQRLAGTLGLHRDVRDLEVHWIAWRSEWERKLAANETQFLRGVADLQSAFQHRATLMDANYRDMVSSQHRDFEAALERNTLDVQRRLWADLERIKLEYQSLIHHELRLLRQKPLSPVAAPSPAGQTAPTAAFDGWTFAEKFRGPVEYVKANQHFYLDRFRGRRNIVDLGCGRGEFLELLKENGIDARGVDSDSTCVASCQERGLAVTQGDLFAFLEAEPPKSLDGIFCCQVVEHLPRMRVHELVRLAQSRLARGGVLAMETPNPESLAIFATHFYLDPTHQHPLPPALLAFYFTEAGFEVEVKRLQPAIESMPELASLEPRFRDKFFGSLDYAVLGVNAL